MENDIGETTNLKDSIPIVFNELCLELRDYLKDVSAQMPILNDTMPGYTGTSPDADADGLDDSWEFSELLTVAYDSTGDPDGDGMNNLMEFTMGTDPYTFDSLATANDPSLDAAHFSIFPNPGSEEIALQNLGDIDWIQVINLEGKIVLETKRTEKLSIKSLPIGRYTVVTLKAGNRVDARPLLIMR